MSQLCHICHNHHNHASCPYCGAIRIGRVHYDRYNGRVLARASGLPRVVSEQLTAQVTRLELPRLISRLSREVSR